MKRLLPCAIVAGVTFVSTILLTPNNYAVSAYPGLINYTQPDGSTIEIRIEGDERGHEIYSADGHLLVFDNNGYLVYAEIDNAGGVTPSSVRVANTDNVNPAVQKHIRSISSQHIEKAVRLRAEVRKQRREEGIAPKYIFSGTPFPSTGSPKALVVLVEFPDKQFTMEESNEFYTAQLNEKGYNLLGAVGSARDYFIKNSNGLFSPEFDVMGPVMMKNPTYYYGSNDEFGNDLRPDEMIIEACTSLAEEHDLSVYDHDMDGYIDNVFVIYAGYGEADTGNRSLVWPHSADIEDDFKKTVEVGNVKLNRYGCTCELTNTYGNRPDGIGVFVHEFSHVLGLPDLYSTIIPHNNTPKHWSLLDQGNYNFGGIIPPNYSSFEKYSLGWIEPKEFDITGDYIIPYLADSNECYIVRTDNENEFFMFETRMLKGFDSYLPAEGMLVWHIQFSQTIWDRNTVNNNSKKPLVDLIEADNKSGISTEKYDAFPGFYKITELSYDTLPMLSTWDGDDTGYYFSRINYNDGLTTLHVDIRKSGIDKPTDEITSSTLVIDGLNFYNNSNEIICIYDISGRKVMTLSPHESKVIESHGIYITSSGQKIRI